jgi:eukaryotic-like serine/threonine-protein kinase
MSALFEQVDLPPRYRVVRHIANGGMATVWAAEDAVLQRLVAVKVLAAGYAADPSARRRFTREARAAARVSDHLNVVTIFDIGEMSSGPTQAFIVMEHFAGGTVADRLKAGEPIPVPLALRWLRETASALDAAHAADIVHRDVKPGNLLLDEHGRLAVGDFGIASIVGETAMTAAGQILGTAAYLSPEQARGQTATSASDRYSLAVVAFELLCGRRPFDGDTPMAQARARVEQEPAVPGGPCAAAGDVLTWGLAREAADRPPTATAFVAALEDALSDATHQTHVTTVMSQTMPVREPRFARHADGALPREAVRREPPPDPVARQRSPHYRAFLLAGLTAVCLAAGAGAALISDDGNDGGRDATAPRAVGSKPQAAAPSPRRAQTSPSSSGTATPGPATPATPDDGRSAATINNAGYAMLPGNPQGALPLLARAVEKFRAEGNTRSLDYAFSLYNYGWALRLAGRPSEAIPLLQERLQISNYKRGIVRKELKTAEQAAAASG